MTTEELLKNKIKNEIDFNEDNIISKEIDIDNISFEDLKYYLLEIGKITEEDVENSIYVVCIKSGFLNANKSTMSIKYNKKKITIMAFAKEGVVGQNTNKKAIKKIEDRLNNLPTKSKTKNKIKNTVCISIVLIIVIIVAFVLWRSREVKIVTKNYNQEISVYNEKVDDYNGIAKTVDVSNIADFSDIVDKLPKEKENYFSAVLSMLKGNTPSKIDSDIKTLEKMEEDLQNKCLIMKDIKNPSKEWVVERMKRIKGTRDVKPITKENDTSGLYKKENGGFEECIYFISDNAILKEKDKKKDSIDLGVDGGGAVEVYKTINDAKKRCDYLKQFDGTLLYSGSYALIGTMVVRTSYNLPSDEQYKLTSEIFKALTE